jgi:hypothetical protein
MKGIDNMANQTIRLVDFTNRVCDFEMKGTYGYNPSGASILTAVSYVEELVVTGTEVFDEDGNNLPSPVVKGIDKYGREMVLPIDRILAVGWLDTKEQGHLKALESLIPSFESIPNLDTVAPELFQNLQDFKAQRDELIEQGVTLYQRGE